MKRAIKRKWTYEKDMVFSLCYTKQYIYMQVDNRSDSYAAGSRGH